MVGTAIVTYQANRSDQEVTFLEIGHRASGDGASYPTDDIEAVLVADGTWTFTHKDGRRY